MKKLFTGLLIICLVGVVSCVCDPYYQGGGHMMGYGHGGVWIMWLLIVSVIILAAYLLIRETKKKDLGTPQPETPLEILKKRYARGEISKEQLEEMRRDIES
jgi:putative membrane protein